MKFADKQNKVIEKYVDAESIYILQRSKKMKTKHYVLDFFVALFTPLAGIMQEADIVADMGTYYLVNKDKKNLLVRVDNKEIAEKDITGLCDFNAKQFVLDGNKYVKAWKVNG